MNYFSKSEVTMFLVYWSQFAKLQFYYKYYGVARVTVVKQELMCENMLVQLEPRK